MKRVIFIITCFLLAACSRFEVTSEPQASLILPLYPQAEWSEVKEAIRTFVWEGKKTEVKGWEVAGTYDDDLQEELFYKDSENADQDFWHFYLGEETLVKLGYKTIIVEEMMFDRQFVGLQDEENHVLLLSNLVDFAVTPSARQSGATGVKPYPEAPECPCTYTFTIFSDDERVMLE